MKCSSNIATRIYGLFVIACQILFFAVLAFLYDEFTFGFRLIRHMPYEEFIWIIQQPSHNTVVTTSCYLLRDILSCGSLFGIVHLLLRSPIRNRWKIFIPGIGFVILAAFLFLLYLASTIFDYIWSLSPWRLSHWIYLLYLYCKRT